MEREVLKDINGKNIVGLFAQIAPYYRLVNTADVGISVWDRNICVVYIPADNLNFDIKPGDVMKPRSAGETAMREKRRVLVEMSREKSPWGIPYIVNAMPFLDQNNEAIGCVITTERTDKLDTIRQTASILKSSSEHLASALQSLSDRSESANKSGLSLREKLSIMSTIVKDTNKIVSYINNIASQTNVLGLNASIEAARIGGQGRGFAVVAEEVRKLAIQSIDSGKQIKTVVQAIEDSFSHIDSKSTDVQRILGEQVALIQEIAASGEELAAVANQLQAMTQF